MRYCLDSSKPNIDLNKLLESILKNTSDIIIIISPDYKIIEFNPNAELFFNASKKKLSGKNYGEFCQNLKISDVLEKSFLGSNKKTSFKGYSWSNISIVSNKGATYVVIGHQIYHDEIQSKKSHESENKLLRDVIASVPGSIYWKNTEGTYLGCNDFMVNNTGLKSRKDIIGKSDFELWPKQAKMFHENDQQVIQLRRAIRIEEQVDLPNGKKRYFTVEKTPLYSDDNHIIGIIGNSIEITELKEMQAALKKAKEAAEAGEKAKTIFIANMSHDIRTPLTGVIGLGHILEDEAENPEQKEHAHNIAASGDALLDMLNQVISAVASGRLTTDDVHEEPFDIQFLIQSIVDLENSSVDFKDIELRTTIDERIPTILIGDHKKIYHVILNLVGNAIKFTKTGHVSINVTLAEKRNNSVQLLFEVSDTGSGIPTESLDKIFELFYRETPSYKGLDKGHGVGLHIAKTYTELLGGKITVDSKVNEGSRFSFKIPLKIADENAIPKNISEELPPVDNSQKASSPKIQTTISEKTKTSSNHISNAPEVLVIEDNPIALSVAQSIVQQTNCNPTPASDGESALALATTKPFDLILSDVGLPGISGIEFTEQLRKHEEEQNKPPVPIVAVTGHAEGKIHEECIAAGMNEVIIKPINTQALTEVCDRFSLFTEHNDEAQPRNETTECSSSQSVDAKDMLKADLPDTEDELFEIDSLPIFDIEIGINFQIHRNHIKSCFLCNKLHRLHYISEILLCLKVH